MPAWADFIHGLVLCRRDVGYGEQEISFIPAIEIFPIPILAVHPTLVWVGNWRADTIFHSPVPKRLFGVGWKSRRRLLTYGHT